MQRYLFLLLTAFGLFALISDSKAGPPFGPPPRHGCTGGVAYSEYHHRPYYYRRYHYGPANRPPATASDIAFRIGSKKERCARAFGSACGANSSYDCGFAEVRFGRST